MNSRLVPGYGMKIPRNSCIGRVGIRREKGRDRAVGLEPGLENNGRRTRALQRCAILRIGEETNGTPSSIVERPDCIDYSFSVSVEFAVELGGEFSQGC